MVASAETIMSNQNPESELDAFLTKSTIVFKKWSLLICLLIYCSFSVMDFFRFPPNIYEITIPLRVTLVILPLIFSVYLHWFLPVTKMRSHLWLNLFIYLNVGLMHIFIFIMANTTLGSHFSDLGFILLIFFGCLMMVLPVIPTAIVNVVLLTIMFVVNTIYGSSMSEIIFRIAVYALIMTMCLIVNGSAQRLLTANFKMIRQFYDDSITDRLTNLRNSRFFIKQTLNLINKAKAEHKKVSLLLIDIDNFKEMNDKHGHAYGDHCLSNLGEILRSVCSREYDFPCRLAGDEFAIVMYDAEQVDINKVCQDLLTDIQLYDMAVSIGTATTIVEDTQPSMLIKDKLFDAADKALYKAKDNGRNTFYSAIDLV
jgi:diguanylate cyclase (GGDEF)-like protein